MTKMPSLIHFPFTMGILAEIRTSLAANPLEYDNILTWAAAYTEYFGLFRASEFLTPDTGHWDPRSTWLWLMWPCPRSIPSRPYSCTLIKASKTDQLRVGAMIIFGTTKVPSVLWQPCWTISVGGAVLQAHSLSVKAEPRFAGRNLWPAFSRL